MKPPPTIERDIRPDVTPTRWGYGIRIRDGWCATDPPWWAFTLRGAQRKARRKLRWYLETSGDG